MAVPLSFSVFKRGFTLVELLIVIAVIGLLAGGVILTINPAAQIQRSRDAKRKADLSDIQKALEISYQDKGEYPSVSEYKIVGLNGNPVLWGTSWLPYMGTLPKDPISPSKSYIYNVSENKQSYYIYASLDIVADGITLTHLPANVDCGNYDCNYGVSSPNTNP